MKQCPQCDRTYDDDTLRFCLEDGALLKVAGTPTLDPNATVLYGSRETWEKQLPEQEVEPTPPPAPRSYKNPGLGSTQNEAVHREKRQPQTPPQTPPRTSRLLTGGVLAIAAMLLVGGVVGAAYLFSQKKHDQTLASTPNTPNNNLKESAPSPKQDNSAAKGSEKAASADGLNTKGSPLQIKVTASSVRYSVQSNTYDPANTIDGSQATAWIEGKDGPGSGEWLKYDFDREINLHRILILPGYFKSPDIWAKNNRV